MNKKILGLALTGAVLILSACKTADVVPGPVRPVIDPPKDVKKDDLAKVDSVTLDARLLTECPVTFSAMPADPTPLTVLAIRRQDVEQALQCALLHNKLVLILKEKLQIKPTEPKAK